MSNRPEGPNQPSIQPAEGWPQPATTPMPGSVPTEQPPTVKSPAPGQTPPETPGIKPDVIPGKVPPEERPGRV